MVSATATEFVAVERRKTSKRRELTEAYTSLLLFMAVYWARPTDWIPGLSTVPLAKIAAALALVALVLSLSQIRHRLPPEVGYVFLLIAQLFATAVMSPVWKGGALQTTLDFAKVGLIVFMLVMAVNTAKRLRQLFFIQAASVAAISAVAVWKGRLLGTRLEGVLNGNYSNPNDLALAIVISLPLCLALLLLSKNNLSKAVWAFAMVVMVYAVFLTGSRGGFLSLAIAAAVCLWEFGIRGRRPILLALTAVMGVLLWVSSGTMLSERLKGTFDSRDDAASAYGSAQQRQELLWRSVEITIAHPLFGVGPGNFQVMSGSWHGTHNSYMQMSSEGGVPALILYTLILWCGFKNVSEIKRLVRKKKELGLLVQALQASLSGFVVGSLFASDAFQFFPYFLVAYTRAFLWIAREAASPPAEGKSSLAGMTPQEIYGETNRSANSVVPLQLCNRIPGYLNFDSSLD
jgi:putative inorganic carbon (hco3(-)) transporter